MDVCVACSINAEVFEASLTNAIPFSLPTCLMVFNEEYSMRNKVPTYDSQSFSNWNKGHKKIKSQPTKMDKQLQNTTN